ncbi:OmpA family protein [Sanyastnella coralliicola]|uniref:OmpA family protein n=1 Tax=Sanyastnella coralliicola TaxID=3069118 RepID=UPI0027B8E6F4|nr:OmpA family protein [Longitalea sp. SCSIO 12813]
MKFLLSLLLSAAVIAVTAQNSQSHYVLFDSDSHEISASAEAGLLDALSQLAYIRSLRIEAHTDADGSDAYNEALAQRRLNSVESLLADKGYTVTQKGAHGEDSPIADNETEDGKQQNRRVLVRFEGDRELLTMEDIYEEMMPNMQSHCIDNTKDTVLVAKSGTVMFIPAYSFKVDNHDDCIELRLREALDLTDMMTMNMHTGSDGTMLESGGTVYLEAYLNGERISGELEKDMTIYFPTNRTEDDMLAFSSEEGGDEMNWVPTGESFELIPLKYINDSFNVEFKKTNRMHCRLFFCKIRRALRLRGKESNSTYIETRSYGDGYVLDSAFYDYDQKKIDAAYALGERMAKLNRDVSAMYAGNVRNMQFINCDRFPETPVSPVEVICAADAPANVRALVPSVNGMMQGNNMFGNPTFLLPSDRRIVYVSIIIQDNESYLAIQEASEEREINLNYEKLTPTQIKYKLKGLKL